MNDDHLKELRDRIDALDDEILRLLNDRAKIALEIGELKQNGAIYRPEREAQVLRRLQELNRGPMPAAAVARLFTEVMSACRALEDSFSVAFLGPRGTFSEEAAIKHFGGCIGRFTGDGLLVYFGYPQAHEDDAERAVRAGLEIVGKVGQILLPSGHPLQVRVGIATGVVVVGEDICEGSAREQAVFGETPNLATRLQQLAPPNSVIVAASTHRLIGAAFVCADLGGVKVKGRSRPVGAWRIISERVVESRFDAIRSKRLTRFVGRQEQLNRLWNFWEQAKSGSGQVALLCGEPGIGKSRITNTLLDSIAEEHHVMLRCQCSPHHTNSPFFPIINQLERAARFEREDSPHTKLDKLEALLAQAGDESLADAPLFAALLSIPPDTRYRALEFTPKRQKELTITALARQLLGRARFRPVLFLIEDVHWIDATTLEAISRSIPLIKTARVLLLITFRSEFMPPWLDQSHVTMLRLNDCRANRSAP
jgi:chorismate mutase-like protein